MGTGRARQAGERRVKVSRTQTAPAAAIPIVPARYAQLWATWRRVRSDEPASAM
jgi:hypothetical protein